MSLSAHLIEQARDLSTAGRSERGAPRQADLRRAVSAAYFALFHFLIDKACERLIGVAAERRTLRVS